MINGDKIIMDRILVIITILHKNNLIARNSSVPSFSPISKLRRVFNGQIAVSRDSVFFLFKQICPLLYFLQLVFTVNF